MKHTAGRRNDPPRSIAGRPDVRGLHEARPRQSEQKGTEGNGQDTCACLIMVKNETSQKPTSCNSVPPTCGVLSHVSFMYVNTVYISIWLALVIICAGKKDYIKHEVVKALVSLALDFLLF